MGGWEQEEIDPNVPGYPFPGQNVGGFGFEEEQANLMQQKMGVPRDMQQYLDNEQGF
jgi:hypothetical protein